MYRTVAQLDSLTQALAAWFPGHFTRVQLPEPSVEGRAVYALRLRYGGGGARRGVLLLGGTHARELMNPDAIAELAVDLFVSRVLGNDLTYGGRTWSALDIRLIVDSLDVWMLPCSNPDGRAFVMTTDDMWRKNRRVNAGTACRGVDLNRNCDMLWGVTQGSTSCDPCSAVYVGSAPFSEPESRNVKHLLDTERIDCFADVHSFSELVLHPWGHAPTQTVDPTQRFTGLPTGTCAPMGIPGYEEYLTPRDQLRFTTVGDRIVTAVKDVRGRVYTRQSGIGLYATTGTHSDYAFSRHISDADLRKTYGFTFETGEERGSIPESFHPADPEPAKQDAKTAMIALMQQCICAIELIGMRFLGRGREVAALRNVRDELLGSTAAGRAWITVFERSQAAVLHPLLQDERLAAEAADLVAIAGRAVATRDARLDDETVDRSTRLLAALGERTEDPRARTDLEAVASRLERLRGRSSAEVIEDLMAVPPDDLADPEQSGG